MNVEPHKVILAIFTTGQGVVQAGGAPVFTLPDAVEAERQAVRLARILDAMVHDVPPGTYLLIRH